MHTHIFSLFWYNKKCKNIQNSHYERNAPIFLSLSVSFIIIITHKIDLWRNYSTSTMFDIFVTIDVCQQITKLATGRSTNRAAISVARSRNFYQLARGCIYTQFDRHLPTDKSVIFESHSRIVNDRRNRNRPVPIDRSIRRTWKDRGLSGDPCGHPFPWPPGRHGD